MHTRDNKVVRPGRWVSCQGGIIWHAQARLLGLLLGMAGCGAAPGDVLWLESRSVKVPASLMLPFVETHDMRWLQQLAQVPLGDDVDASDPASYAALEALGFVQEQAHTFRRVAPLHETAMLVPTHVPELPSIAAIAMISIDRHAPQPPYIYATLRSLFANLPAGIEINVLVGDADAAYVAPQCLQRELGAANAAHVHVHPAAAATATFLRANHRVHARATWNYARALRSFAPHAVTPAPPQHVLLLEDDIAWAAGSTPALARWLQSDAPPMLSLYNFFCERLPGGSPEYRQRARLVRMPIQAYRLTFARTQAMLYSHAWVAQLGAYMALRLTEQPYDHLADHFMRQHQLHIGFAEPSMVQHMGRDSTGLGYFHESACFLSTYPTSN